MTLTIKFYRDAAGEWRWRAVAGNNQIIGNSGEGYINKGDCVSIAQSLFLGQNAVTFEYLAEED